MTRLFVRPAVGLKVRHATHGRHIRVAGERVDDATYYRRRIAAGDLELVDAEGEAMAEATAELVQAVERLDPAEPSHWTKAGQHSLNHLTDALGRRVTREEVDHALAIIGRK